MDGDVGYVWDMGRCWCGQGMKSLVDLTVVWHWLHSLGVKLASLDGSPHWDGIVIIRRLSYLKRRRP